VITKSLRDPPLRLWRQRFGKIDAGDSNTPRRRQAWPYHKPHSRSLAGRHLAAKAVKNLCNGRCTPSPRGGSVPGLSGRRSRAAVQQVPAASPARKAAAPAYHCGYRSSRKYGPGTRLRSTVSDGARGDRCEPVNKISERSLRPGVCPGNFRPTRRRCQHRIQEPCWKQER